MRVWVGAAMRAEWEESEPPRTKAAGRRFFDVPVSPSLHSTPDMGGDPFSLLLDQRIIFLGGEVR